MSIDKIAGVSVTNIAKVAGISSIAKIVDFAWALPEKGYVYGGYSGGYLQDCDEYSPDTWTSKTDMPSPGRHRSAASTI